MNKQNNVFTHRSPKRSPETSILNARDMEHMKARLVRYREEVLDDLKSEQEVLRSASAERAQGWDMDFAGESSDTEATEQAAVQVRRLTAILEQINAALGRIDHGDYGRCTRCGTRIERERLEAIPYTRRCVNCKMVSEAA